jgi:hypothetical protein
MSRDLPARPNLEHLKNQAKDRLPELQRQNPSAQLADAQHAIAREYGFASWPKLKSHVESMPPPAQNPFVGTWQANLARSKRHAANQFQAATINFAVSGDTVTITDGFVDADGKKLHGRNTLKVDGQAHSTDRAGYVLVAKWRGPHVLETLATKDGEVVGRGRYEVSADGMTMTVSDGSGDQLIVLEKD